MQLFVLYKKVSTAILQYQKQKICGCQKDMSQLWLTSSTIPPRNFCTMYISYKNLFIVDNLIFVACECSDNTTGFLPHVIFEPLVWTWVADGLETIFNRQSRKIGVSSTLLRCC